MSLTDEKESTPAEVLTDAVIIESADTAADTAAEETNDCCCCHCLAMKRAIKRAEFLKSPAGQRRLYMKLAAKNFFMDFMAITKVRKEVLDTLHDNNAKSLSRHHSFPVSICKVEELTEKTLLIKWWVHDASDVDHYKIYIDNQLVKCVYDPKSEETIVGDVDTNKQQRIRMKAIPKRIADRKYRELEEDVRNICCVCAIPKPKPKPCDERKQLMTPLQKKYFTNLCEVTSDTWEDSEFLYIPDCECDTYV